MTALFVSPDYLSHYLPMSAVGAAAQALGADVVFATGDGLRDRVLADGFDHVPLRLGAASNAAVEIRGDDAALDEFVAATRGGMVETLTLQARRRVDDLLWEAELVAEQLEGIVRDVRPAAVLSDQLAFGASLALRALDVPFTSFLPGHPVQLPPLGTPFGFPGRRPAGFGAEDLAGLYMLCAWAARAFTRRYNRTLRGLAPGAAPVEDAFAAGGTAGTVVAYPAELGRRRHGATFVGPCIRDEADDPSLVRGSRPRAYVALGSFLSARSDVLQRIAAGLRRAGLDAVIASGLTPPEALGPLPDGWVVRPSVPQVAALRHCDVVVSHGGNNTAMEALAAGLPVVALPFSTDQFAVAADFEDAGIGRALDPNSATAEGIGESVLSLLAPGPRERAARLGRVVRRVPGEQWAARELLRSATRDRLGRTTTGMVAAW